MFDDHDCVVEALPLCVNCGRLMDEGIPTPCGPVCSDDCAAALSEFLAEAHRPRPAVRDYLERDECPF